MLLDHLDGILNYCRTKVPFGVVEARRNACQTEANRRRTRKGTSRHSVWRGSLGLAEAS
jgi:hypothetical protein